MTEIISVKLAIISDLHCHPEFEKTADNNTWLFSDQLRVPTNEHPVENLLEIIKQKKITVNYVLSPGDYAHQAHKQGLLSGWSYVNELARAMSCSEILGTIGNHDIDSRHNYSNYSFDMPKKMKQDFPLKEEIIGKFWESGYSFIDTDKVQFLIINSAHYHTHYERANPDEKIDNPAIKGKIDPAQLEEIDKILAAHCDHSKIKIAMSHHPPIMHSRSGLGELDYIENGEGFKDLLGKFKFDLLIYGHKHDPWMRYIITGSGHFLPTFSAGSFSATNQLLYAGKFNYFHLIDIVKHGNNIAHGQIETYTYQNKIGWEQNKDRGFLTNTGFGNHEAITTIADRVFSLFGSNPIIPWQQVIQGVPEINNLTPERMEELEKELESRLIYVKDKIGLNPKHIYHADN